MRESRDATDRGHREEGHQVSAITGCLTSLPASFDIASATHIEVGFWHNDQAGCGATDASATTTSGPYKVQSFADGSELLTIYGNQVEGCGRTQGDVRWRGADGELYRFEDFVFNAGVDCERRQGQVGSEGFAVGLHGGGGDWGVGSVAPPEITPFGFTPVPEPATWACVGLGLLAIGRTIRQQKSRTA